MTPRWCHQEVAHGGTGQKARTAADPAWSADHALLLGLLFDGGDADYGRPHMNHHPGFNIVESSLAAGVKTEVQIVLDVLGVG
jgi:hypothetical protein